MGGDPGVDGPPKRNAGVVFVADVSAKPVKIVFFHWVDGRGSYSPFLVSYKYCIEKYSPVLKGLDVTGTQKAIDELAFENYGIDVDGINFARDKDALLNSMSLALTNHDLQMPFIQGLHKQLSHYSREKDRQIAQDTVMALSIIAYLSRHVYDGNLAGGGSVPPRRPRRRRSNIRRRR
jgi:hypothetical protein